VTDVTKELGTIAHRIADLSVLVIFGASGDLTKRKLIPALYNLARGNLLARNFAIIGFAYGDLTTDALREQLTSYIKNFATVPVDPELWDWFVRRIYYARGSFDNAEDYQALAGTIDEVSKEHGIYGNHVLFGRGAEVLCAHRRPSRHGGSRVRPRCDSPAPRTRPSRTSAPIFNE
jgi:Glucose-6-phosphate dehydrogenase, NAD binding domain